MSAPLVAIRGLDVGYLRRRRVTPAVRGLDLTIARGEVVAIVGESGSGKTTTANAVLGLLPYNGRITAGSIVVAGVETAHAKERTLRSLRGSTVALIPQDPMTGLSPTRRVGSHVADAVRAGGPTSAGVDADVVRALQQAGLPDARARMRQYPHELSGGQRQRVLIAMALAGRPELIIADEPTSALDVTVQKRILDHLTGLVSEQGISLLIITHDLAVATDRADRVVVMRHGQVLETGPSRQILSDPQQPYTRNLISSAPGLAHGGRLVPRYGDTGAPTRHVDPVLTLTDLTKTFPARHGNAHFAAVDGVSLTVARGRTHALVGESGSGKTTTLRIALGLETPTSGSIVFCGVELGGGSWRAMRPQRRRMQFVHQDPFASLDPRFTVKQSVIEPLVSFGVGDRRSRATRAVELLDQVALPSAFLDRLPRELSGGQRQRVAIARALALEPELLLLDEPLSALDVSIQAQILQLLSRLQEDLGLSYLFVTHDLGVVAEIAHTVTVLRNGRVVEQGSAADVFLSPHTDYTRELLEAVPGRGRPAAEARA